MPGKVKMAAFPGKTLSSEEVINLVFLARPDLQNNMALGGQMGPRPACNAAVGLQPIGPAIKRLLGVKFTHIRRQTGDIAQGNIGRI